VTTADRPLRVFVNATGVDVPPGSTALDAVRAWSPEEADAVSRGERVITDSRGLPVAATVVARDGSIFRLVGTRKTQNSPDRAASDDSGAHR
jgi:hypothetical protein